ncbi:hypothetical protein KKC60_05955 [Patescibacteria group bacterium]|nr:hypothetical protein [Patescibacteria group bacterium]
MKFRRKRKKEDSKEHKKNLSLDLVESYLKEKTRGGSAMALIETEKILGEILERLGYAGKNNDTRLIPAKNIIDNFEELETARLVTKKIETDIDAKVDNEEAKATLSAYWEAIRFLTNSQKEKGGVGSKVGRFFGRKTSLIKKIIKRGLIYFFLFFLIVYILDSTAIGHQAVDFLVRTSHFLFSWILFTFLLVVGILVIVISTIFYFERRKERKSKITIEKENDGKIPDIKGKI